MPDEQALEYKPSTVKNVWARLDLLMGFVSDDQVGEKDGQGEEGEFDAGELQGPSARARRSIYGAGKHIHDTKPAARHDLSCFPPVQRWHQAGILPPSQPRRSRGLDLGRLLTMELGFER